MLLADRAVEIIADRGIAVKITQQEWDTVCHEMQAAYGRGEFERGSVSGLNAIACHLALHFSGTGSAANELPDAPIIL